MWPLFLGYKPLKSIDFTKIYQLKSLQPKNKGRTNFYLRSDLTKKIYLMYCYHYIIFVYLNHPYNLDCKLLLTLMKQDLSESWNDQYSVKDSVF